MDPPSYPRIPYLWDPGDIAAADRVVPVDERKALDLWRPDTGFCGSDERDELCERNGLAVPLRLFSGLLRTEEALLALLGPSRFGAPAMEGVVIRRDDGQACKVVAPGFVRAGDNRIGRRRNALLGLAGSPEDRRRGRSHPAGAPVGCGYWGYCPVVRTTS